MGDLGTRALERWVRERAVEIDLGAPDDAAFAALAPLADRARVAVLAESHHFVREKYAFRTAVIRWLAGRGWRWFGEELGWTDGVRVDEHLAGDQAALAKVPTYGHVGARRRDRDDRPWGVLRASDDAFPRDAFAAAQTAFARSLEGLGLRWFGFDVDGWTTAALELLAEQARADPAVAALAARLAQVPGESLATEAARAAAVASSAGPLAAPAARALDALAGTLRYAELAYPAAEWEALRPAMAERERLMHRHVDAVLDDPAFAGPDGRVALQAGSLHLLKDDGLVGDASPGIGPGGGLVASIGHHVAHRPDVGPDRVLAIWMLCGHGRDTNPSVPDARAIAPQRGTLNAALDRAADGQALVVPLAGLPGRVRIQHMYGATFTTPAEGQIDAVVYVPRVHPL